MLLSYARTALTWLQRERTADSVMGLQLMADSYHCSTFIDYKLNGYRPIMAISLYSNN